MLDCQEADGRHTPCLGLSYLQSRRAFRRRQKCVLRDVHHQRFVPSSPSIALFSQPCRCCAHRWQHISRGRECDELCRTPTWNENGRHICPGWSTQATMQTRPCHGRKDSYNTDLKGRSAMCGVCHDSESSEYKIQSNKPQKTVRISQCSLHTASNCYGRVSGRASMPCAQFR